MRKSTKTRIKTIQARRHYWFLWIFMRKSTKTRIKTCKYLIFSVAFAKYSWESPRKQGLRHQEMVYIQNILNNSWESPRKQGLRPIKRQSHVVDEQVFMRKSTKTSIKTHRRWVPTIRGPLYSWESPRKQGLRPLGGLPGKSQIFIHEKVHENKD